MKIQHGNITIYFADKQHCVQPDEIKPGRIVPAHKILQNMIGAKAIYLLEQVHGIQGYQVTPYMLENIPSFAQEGDFLYTNEKEIALGVDTADCLPIVIYHSLGVISIVHAGWRGSFENIAQESIQTLLKTYPEIKVSELIVYFGPAGKACCYEVQQDFIQKFVEKYPWSTVNFIKRNDRWYFDNGDFTSNLLQKIGILPENIYTKWNICTICNEKYCSYRREQQQAGRHITLVMLNALP
jgi:hypothetical protein